MFVNAEYTLRIRLPLKPPLNGGFPTTIARQIFDHESLYHEYSDICFNVDFIVFYRTFVCNMRN